MSKSYWMREQKGNFTNDKKDTFDPTKGYIGLRLQQGVPLLDRDWNELEDIRRYEELMLRKYYIGNGSPDDGFKISACNPPANDFMIGTGRCMVEGFEVVSDLNYYDKSENKYSLQKLHVPIEEPIPTLTIPSEERVDIVYLDIWVGEVTGKITEQNINLQDLQLNNPQDLDEETTIRHKIMWNVRVDEGSKRDYKIEYVPIKPGKADKLAKLVIDSKKKYTIKVGEILDLGKEYALKEKYALKVAEIDNSGEKVTLEFIRGDASERKENISVSGETGGTWEVELDDIEDEDDVVVFRVHVNQVFQGAVDSIAQIEGLWLIDYVNPINLEDIKDREKIDESYYHRYYDLAKITRIAGQEKVSEENIQDLRKVNGPVQEDWINVNFNAGWNNYDEKSYNSAGYFRDTNGIVHLRGAVVCAEDSKLKEPVFTLPESYRPAKNELYIVASCGDTTQFKTVTCKVSSNGDVAYNNGASKNYGIFLDGITFRV